MISITIKPAYRKHNLDEVILHSATICLENEGKPGDVGILVTGDKEIRSYNLNYRGIDAPTDVLSFENGEVNPETGNIYWGDIIISCQTALRQSDEENHALTEEISLLVVHGILHLLGYDHQDNEGRETMWTRQADILSSMGISIDSFPNLEKLG